MCLHQTRDHLHLKELLNNTNLKKGETSVAKNQTNNKQSVPVRRRLVSSRTLIMFVISTPQRVLFSSLLPQLFLDCCLHFLCYPKLNRTLTSAFSLTDTSLTGIQHDVLNVFHHKHIQ